MEKRFGEEEKEMKRKRETYQNNENKKPPV